MVWIAATVNFRYNILRSIYFHGGTSVLRMFHMRHVQYGPPPLLGLAWVCALSNAFYFDLRQWAHSPFGSVITTDCYTIITATAASILYLALLILYLFLLVFPVVTWPLTTLSHFLSDSCVNPGSNSEKVVNRQLSCNN